VVKLPKGGWKPGLGERPAERPVAERTISAEPGPPYFYGSCRFNTVGDLAEAVNRDPPSKNTGFWKYLMSHVQTRDQADALVAACYAIVPQWQNGVAGFQNNFRAQIGYAQYHRPHIGRDKAQLLEDALVRFVPK
jgi:hypothetical protein